MTAPYRRPIPTGHVLPEARPARTARCPARAERRVGAVDGAAFAAVATLMVTLLPTTRVASLVVVAAFVGAYAVASRVEFEIGPGATIPTQLVFVPMLFVLPANVLPLAVAAGLVLGDVRGFLDGRIHPARAIGRLGNAWFAVGPAAVLVLAGEPSPAWSHAPLYVALLAAQFGFDLAHAAIREWCARRIDPRVLLRPFAWIWAVDAMLAPTGLLVALAVIPAPATILLVLPLLALLGLFAKERAARVSHAIELTDVRASARELDALARTDQLTGIANRRTWDERLPALLDHAAAVGTRLYVAMIDLDHFKRYNDTHGHQRGDRLLAEAASAWSAQLRADDLLARYGGEEFGLALPSRSIEDATRLLDRLLRATPDGQTCSIGIAEWDGEECPEALVARADTALYLAKREGRNRRAVAARR